MDVGDFVDFLSSPDRGECSELALVLAAQSIPSAVRRADDRWVLSVPRRALAAARLEVEAYRAESRHARPPRPAATPDGTPWPGIFVYVGVLLTMSLIAPDMRFGIDWLAAGRMDGGGLRAGDWWRPVTALTLHADAAHLLGNVFFGSFFAYSVSRYLGGGFGWLVVIVSAALANVANGMLLGADHRSIGASTAVFAALGLLSGYLWRCGFPAAASRRERLAPVLAGIGLLVFTGTGGVNTDLTAHLLGFVFGFGAGAVVARTGRPRTDTGQLLAAGVALLLVAGAWAAALAA